MADPIDMRDHGDGDGGDPACWLDQVCERCGAIVTGGQRHECRRPVPRGGAGE